MVDPIFLAPESAFAGLLRPAGTATDPGVTVRELAGLPIATLIACTTLSGLIDAPKRTRRDGTEYLGVGPGKWLALGSVAAEFAHAASVIDQSGAYGVLELAGPSVRAVLEKGIGIDLHPRKFAPDDVAVTLCGHIGVIVWRGEGESFRLAVFRSHAASFWHWLESSAAGFGLRIASP